jgi:hypothetical protein
VYSALRAERIEPTLNAQIMLEIANIELHRVNMQPDNERALERAVAAWRLVVGSDGGKTRANQYRLARCLLTAGRRRRARRCSTRCGGQATRRATRCCTIVCFACTASSAGSSRRWCRPTPRRG